MDNFSSQKDKLNTRVLFICKKRSESKYGSFGLINSAKFVSDYIDTFVNSKVVSAVDGNDIDREVVNYKANIVIIEALWVTPEKMQELLSLHHHKHVTWIIRIHSKISFLANEGIAFKWMNEYMKLMSKFHNLYFSPNSECTTKFLRKHYRKEKIIYLPNIYKVEKVFKLANDDSKNIHIGCFGAIRPMKNQLIQAIAAIEFSKFMGKHLMFHINKHSEQSGEQVYKNIKYLFESCKEIATLVEHEWLDHEGFLELISHMDIGLQVSYNETYNIVTADFISQGVPIVTSPEIKLVTPLSYANPNSINSIKRSLIINYKLAQCYLNRLNDIVLYFNTKKAKRIWNKFIINL